MPLVKETKAEKLSELDNYICEKFGNECNIAVAISKAENGTRVCDRVSPKNKNGTYDIGVFQINTIHLKHYSLSDMKNCRKNVDIAYKIRQSWGNWNAWSAYKNGSYKKFLNE